MTINEALRLIAGIMILFSLYLSVTLSTQWLWFTAFIGLNLTLSAFTPLCLMLTILRKLGFKDN
jgi:hypothetical protein